MTSRAIFGIKTKTTPEWGKNLSLFWIKLTVYGLLDDYDVSGAVRLARGGVEVAAGECRRRRQNQQQQKRHVGAVCSAAADCRTSSSGRPKQRKRDTDLAHLLRTRAFVVTCTRLHGRNLIFEPCCFFWLGSTNPTEDNCCQNNMSAQQSTQDKDFYCGCIRKQKKSRERKTSNWISRQTGKIDKRIHRTI